MLEICFNDSVKGALRQAQHCGKKHDGLTAVLVSSSKSKNKLKAFWEKRQALNEFKKNQKELQKTAIPIGGRREDILGISFYLSVGDIAAPITLEACPRKDLIFSLFTYNRYDEAEDLQESTSEYWRYTIADLERLKKGADKVRVWVDSTPDAYCGLCFIADLLINTNTEIHIVPLPEKYERADNSILEFRSWGEVDPELFGIFSADERILEKNEVEFLSAQWKKLKSENAPLRIVENNNLISADMNYYDDLIRREFPKESCRVAELIGHSLAKQGIPTGDIFIAKRITFFIENGELEFADSSEDGFYSYMLKVKR